jgi:hypothetical protein
MRLLVALGCLEKIVQMREVQFDEKLRDRLYALFTTGASMGEMLCDFYVADLPPWYFEVCIRTHPSQSLTDMWVKMEEVHSVFSGTEYSVKE